MRTQIIINQHLLNLTAWHALCSTPEKQSGVRDVVSFPSGFVTPSPTSSVSPSKSGSAAASLAAQPAETAAQKFLEYANMTPAQRQQAEMLGQLGITEDQFKTMSPEGHG
jgi:hypothetical protein